MPQNTLFSLLTEQSADALKDHRHPEWSRENQATLDRDWRGRSFLKEQGLHWKNLTQAHSLWTSSSLLFLVECWFGSLDGDASDSIEIILRPENCEDYFHWEISPPDRCVDSHVLEPRVDLNYSWRSRCDLEINVSHEERIWRAFIALPFAPIIEAGACDPPEVGEVWGLNFCRKAGAESSREIAMWRPPYGAQPDFHRTACLGNLFFLTE